MALIKCPDCGKDISDKAVSCPNCGCPMSAIITSGPVRIKLPNTPQIAGDWTLIASKKAVVSTTSGKILWGWKTR